MRLDWFKYLVEIPVGQFWMLWAFKVYDRRRKFRGSYPSCSTILSLDELCVCVCFSKVLHRKRYGWWAQGHCSQPPCRNLPFLPLMRSLANQLLQQLLMRRFPSISIYHSFMHLHHSICAKVPFHQSILPYQVSSFETTVLGTVQVSKGGSGDGTFTFTSKGSPRVVFILGKNSPTFDFFSCIDNIPWKWLHPKCHFDIPE